MFKSPNDLSDVLSLAVLCNTDNTMLLIAESNDHWFPCTTASGSMWEISVSKEINELFGPNTDHEFAILRISKILISRHTVPHLLHVVFRVVVNEQTKNKSKNTMGKYRAKCRWVLQADLQKLLTSHNLRSPEILEIYYMAKKESLPGFYVLPDEITFLDNLVETTNENFTSGKGHLTQLVEASGIDKLGQETLLKDFVVTTFPAYYMNIRQFSKIAMNVGWAKESLQSLFYAADQNKRYGITFKEYLYLMAAVDPATSHGGPAAEIRSKYIFKFYDKDRDGVIKGDDFKYLITDLRKMKKNSTDPPAVAQEATDTYKSLEIPEGSPINESDFLKAICDLKIRGTSTLFRSNVGILKLLRDSNDKPKPAPTNPVQKAAQPPQERLDYEVAYHTLKIQRSGQALNIDELRQIQDAVSLTTLKLPVNERSRRNSMDTFSQRSISNEILKALRYLANINKIGVSGGNYTWGQLDPVLFSRNFLTICQQVKDIFKNESRLLEIRSPAYVMGDLHGNISDLLYFEKVLWSIGPGLNPCSLLFLGDYVDRGAYSIEVISYLFAYKVQSPLKINLLRGNHEIREVQKLFTFQKECILKFGEKIGMDVWTTANNAFDNLPIAATIDGKIFCCHGGVPPPWLCPVISAINEIPVPLNQPDAQSSLAWEIMWNDPVRPKMTDEKVSVELLANEGFAVNTRRGTAHIFSVEALERFLKTNQLTHLIRAHEVAAAGFQVLQKGKLLTVFSSSKYCGGRNDAACILVDSGKLRVLRLETN